MNIKWCGNELSVLTQNSPNPSHEYIIINYKIPPDFITGKMIFCNLMGSVIKTVLITKEDRGIIEVNTEDMKSGIYAYSLLIDGREIDTDHIAINVEKQ